MGPEGKPEPRRRRKLFGAALVLLLLSAVALPLYASFSRRSDPAVCDALARARIVTVLSVRGARPYCKGIAVQELEAAEEKRLLGAADPNELMVALRERKATALALVPGALERGVGKQLADLAHVPGLFGVVFSPELAVYGARRPLEFDEKEREALAYVARALLRGAREPSLSSFPPSLRRVERVEVMVVIANPNSGPLLWRSARATSVPRALLTATRVARDRWHEREATMGGALRERLPSLDVSVSLLVEDGTLASSSAPFVDRAITKDHGLGFDYRSDWHYLVPADVQKRGQGSAHKALAQLASDYGLGMHIFARENARLYRFWVQPIATSKATAQK